MAFDRAKAGRHAPDASPPTESSPSDLSRTSRLDASFAALSDATRRGVLEQLERADASITDLAAQFCMTLTDRDEIRQYLTAYLGSTPQVNNFATEFVRRKWGDNGKQEEWESAGGKKGTRKKKGTK